MGRSICGVRVRARCGRRSGGRGRSGNPVRRPGGGRCIEARDDAGAYALLCADARRGTAPDAFTDLVEAGPRPARHEVTGGHLDEAGKHGDVDVVLTDGAGGTRSLHLTMNYDERKWTVCGTGLI
jgi:hypothetical protein